MYSGGMGPSHESRQLFRLSLRGGVPHKTTSVNSRTPPPLKLRVKPAIWACLPTHCLLHKVSTELKGCFGVLTRMGVSVPAVLASQDDPGTDLRTFEPRRSKRSLSYGRGPGYHLTYGLSIISEFDWSGQQRAPATFLTNWTVSSMSGGIWPGHRPSPPQGSRYTCLAMRTVGKTTFAFVKNCDLTQYTLVPHTTFKCFIYLVRYALAGWMVACSFLVCTMAWLKRKGSCN